MDCDGTRKLLSDYLEEELVDGDRAEVAAHLDGCARCAAEAKGLAETLALLSALPQEKAPPEFLERVMAGIGREPAGTRTWSGRIFHSRFKIPFEAAAAVLLLVLVYGIQKEMPVRSGPADAERGRPHATSTPLPNASPSLPDTSPPRPSAPPPARSAETRTAALAGRTPAPNPAPRAEPMTAPDEMGLPDSRARAKIADAGPPPESRKAEFRGSGAPIERAAPTAIAAPALPEVPPARAATALPVAPATRVSSEATPIESKVFAAPPSRLRGPVPFGREVTLEVTSEGSSGIGEKIVAAAERLGGAAHPDPASRTIGASPSAPGAVRVHLPAAATGAFLDALRSLGTIPPEGMPAAVDLPAGPSPEIAAYTVRIRVR